MNKSIVLFYSFEGSTRKASKYLADNLNLAIEEIKPLKDLKAKGFSKYILGGGQVIWKKKPKLEKIKTDLNKYDRIFIGSPIWAGSFTPAIRTLLEGGDLRGKEVAFFYCYDGKADKADRKIEDSVSIYNKLLSTYGLLRVSDSFEEQKKEFLKWAKSMKIKD